MMNAGQEEILELEHRYWQAMKERDGGMTTMLTDDGCIVAGSQGVAQIGRAAIGDMTTKATYELKDFRLTDPVVRIVGDVAIIAYKVHEDLVVDGKPVSLDAADSSTWVKKAGAWVCAAHTESIAGDPFGRDRKQ